MRSVTQVCALHDCERDVACARALSRMGPRPAWHGEVSHLTPAAEYLRDLRADAWLSAIACCAFACEPAEPRHGPIAIPALPRLAVTTALVPTRTVDGRARALYAVWRRGTVEARRELSVHSLQCPLDPFRSVR